MIERIGTVDKIPQFLEDVKSKKELLFGFGHRVYKNYDPRARIVKSTADSILEKLGGDDELLDIAKRLEDKALADDYFVERKLYPNVDFYTGLIYKAMGFPEQMFTVLFAIVESAPFVLYDVDQHTSQKSSVRNCSVKMVLPCRRSRR